MTTNNKVIALPFAGGNKYSFNGIEKHVSKKINWITLELPGRGSRFKESLLDKIDHMVDDLLSQIMPHIQEGNYIIYGHSMGTLLGYELTKKITEKKSTDPGEEVKSNPKEKNKKSLVDHRQISDRGSTLV